MSAALSGNSATRLGSARSGRQSGVGSNVSTEAAQGHTTGKCGARAAAPLYPIQSSAGRECFAWRCLSFQPFSCATGQRHSPVHIHGFSCSPDLVEGSARRARERNKPEQRSAGTGGISPRPHSGQASAGRGQGSQLAVWVVRNWGVEESFGRAWHFEEERRFRRLLKGCLAGRYTVCPPPCVLQGPSFPVSAFWS